MLAKYTDHSEPRTYRRRDALETILDAVSRCDVVRGPWIWSEEKRAAFLSWEVSGFRSARLRLHLPNLSTASAPGELPW